MPAVGGCAVCLYAVERGGHGAGAGGLGADGVWHDAVIARGVSSGCIAGRCAHGLVAEYDGGGLHMVAGLADAGTSMPDEDAAGTIIRMVCGCDLFQRFSFRSASLCIAEPAGVCGAVLVAVPAQGVALGRMRGALAVRRVADCDPDRALLGGERQSGSGDPECVVRRGVPAEDLGVGCT